MAENMDMPPLEEPANKNRTVMIVVIVLVILCCCCIAIGVLGWNYGDQVLNALNF